MGQLAHLLAHLSSLILFVPKRACHLLFLVLFRQFTSLYILPWYPIVLRFCLFDMYANSEYRFLQRH
jgi:hypothetical protein